MARYIDADALTNEILKEYGIDPFYYTDINDRLKAYTDSLILERVNSIPTADVKPVVHAHWAWIDDYLSECSNCNERVAQLVTGRQMDDQLYGGKEYWGYCPHCGAKMDEETDND